MTVTNDATRRIYRLDPRPLRDLQGWLARNERMIEARLDKLGAHLDDMARKRKANAMSDELATFDDSAHDAAHPRASRTRSSWYGKPSAKANISRRGCCRCRASSRSAAFLFTWGSPEGTEGQSVGTIDEFDPPRSIRYRADDGYLQFMLEPVDGGTRLYFIQHFAPRTGLEPQEYPGSDQPAGPDSPWRPGFCAGFHNFLDALGEFLDGKITYEQQRPVHRGRAHGQFTGDFPPHVSRERETELADAYRVHIKANLPGS